MSCDRNRHKYFERLAQRADVQRALGLDATGCSQALERLYQTGQSVGTLKSATEPNELELNLETEMTRSLFERMRALGIKPPTHSADGLPRPGARWGYGQIERLLQAIEGGKPLPAVAASIAEKTRAGFYPRPPAADPGGYLNRATAQHAGALSAVGFDEGGYYRCANCGRFASQKYEHVCPRTATSADLSRMLQRRLGLPEGAFQGYSADPLGALLERARASGEVEMIHALTGRIERLTLDGIPQAVMAGFVPVEWKDHAVPVISENLVNVVGVINADGLARVAENLPAVQQIAQAYGLNLDASSPCMNAYQAMTQSTPLSLVAPAGRSEQAMTLEGGQEYDLGHFIGTEFRKHDARGTFVEIGGKRYGVYARSQNPADKSSARGRFAVDAREIVVGRTLPAAIGILAEGSVTETAGGQIEVYDRNGQLLAVYDPASGTAGDIRGHSNASAEQMAAVLAGRMLHPSSVFDYALIQDFAAFRQGNSSPIAAADSGYLAVRQALEGGGRLRLGARLGDGVRRCPRCGQFVGQGVHVCPTERKAEPLPAEPPVVVHPPGDEVPALAAAQVAPQAVQVSVAVPETFAQDLAAAVGELLSARPASGDNEQLSALLDRLTSLLAAQQEALQKLAQARLDEEKLGAAIARGLPAGGVDLEKLSLAIAGAVARSAPPPVIVSGEGNAAAARAAAKCPRCGQFMSADHQCPPRQERRGQRTRPAEAPPCEVEKILDGIVMAAPDLYLDNVPEEWGGKRAVPLPENIPEWKSDEEYEMGQQERTIYNLIALQLRKKSKRPTNRAFGLYGPAGTGKNTIARMLAANLQCADGKQGLPYYEINITPDMDIAQAIGEVVLTSDENGSTVSRVRLGPIGLCAAGGGVVAINEIVRAPKLATALQSIIEDGEISIPTPEGGTYKVAVHPGALFVTTWNPGYEGDADRPAQAFLSRILALPLDYPAREEQVRRLRAWFAAEGLPPPADEILDAAVGFWNDLRLLSGSSGQTPQIGALSPTRTTPGPRELARFVEIGTRSGWEDALLTLEIICDQDAEYRQTQVGILRERFEAHFAGLV